MYFSDWHGNNEIRGVGGRQRVSNSLELIELPFMVLPNDEANTAAKTTGYVSNGSGNPKGALRRDMPNYLCHVTTVENALEIIAKGAINAGHGGGGTGIYTHACKSMDYKDLIEVYDRLQATAKGGAVFIMKPHGVLVRAPDSHKSKKDEAVGPGGIGFKERNDEASHQYVANPGSVEYMFLLVF